MNKQLIVIAGIIVIVLLGGVLILSQRSSQTSDSMMKSEDSMMKEELTPTDAMMKDDAKPSGTMMEDTDKMMKKDEGMMEKSGSYVPYTAASLADAAAHKRVLFFYANWCPTCKPADAAFEANKDKIPEGVALIRVNYNDTDTDQEEKDLAKKYQVTYQHTFVQIDSSGKEVTRWNGGQIKELTQNIK